MDEDTGMLPTSGKTCSNASSKAQIQTVLEATFDLVKVCALSLAVYFAFVEACV
jgi:hypothetical protein